MSLTNEKKQEFLNFLNSKVGNTKSGFIVAMHEKLTKNQPLTPNMISALQRCVDGEKAVQSVQQSQPVERKFKIKKWYMNELGIDSRYISCNVERETARAFKVTGHADFYKSSQCMRCGRTLTQPASFTLGLGPECASILGVDYPKELNLMDEESAGVYRAMIIGKLRDQEIDCWIPKSQIERELSIEEDLEAV